MPNRFLILFCTISILITGHILYITIYDIKCFFDYLFDKIC